MFPFSDWYRLLVFFYAKKRIKGGHHYAKKSISKNGFRIFNCCNNRSCLCVLQPVCCKRQYFNGNQQRFRSYWSHQQSGRRLYVWKRTSDLGNHFGWIHLCICTWGYYGKPVTLQACIKDFWYEINTPYDFWIRNNLRNSRSYVSCNEFSCSNLLLSVLRRL